MFYTIRQQKKFLRRTRGSRQTLAMILPKKKVKKLRIEIRDDKVLLYGYVNAVDRDSKPLLDEKGQRFIERIVPHTFQRAIEKSDEIFCLLNHEENRVLGSTKQGNIELWEDNIGLRAICEVDDREVIEKAKKDQLRGWSFGFEMLKEHEEPLENGLKRRFVEDMNLFEVSILDNSRVPAYVGTSFETRAEKQQKIEYRSEFFKPKIYIFKPPEKAVFDLSEYRKIFKNLKEKNL
jgi:HK97 family phage prohead protease